LCNYLLLPEEELLPELPEPELDDEPEDLEGLDDELLPLLTPDDLEGLDELLPLLTPDDLEGLGELLPLLTPDDLEGLGELLPEDLMEGVLSEDLAGEALELRLGLELIFSDDLVGLGCELLVLLCTLEPVL
jgi:hypothetical protein